MVGGGEEGEVWWVVEKEERWGGWLRGRRGGVGGGEGEMWWVVRVSRHCGLEGVEWIMLFL